MSFERIGVRENGKVTKWPTLYVDDVEFSREQDPAPNRVLLDNKYFIVLRPGQPTFLPFVARETLMKEIADYEAALADPDAPRKRSVPDDVVDPDEPPPPEDANDEEKPAAPTLPTRRGNKNV